MPETIANQFPQRLKNEFLALIKISWSRQSTASGEINESNGNKYRWHSHTSEYTSVATQHMLCASVLGVRVYALLRLELHVR
jgi:hypothetical protein